MLLMFSISYIHYYVMLYDVTVEERVQRMPALFQIQPLLLITACFGQPLPSLYLSFSICRMLC